MPSQRPTSKSKSADSHKDASRGDGSVNIKSVRPRDPVRPPYTPNRPTIDPVLTTWLEDLWLFVTRYWRELGAILAIVSGAIILLALFSGPEPFPGVVQVSWAERIFGWTAPWLAVFLILTGVLSFMGKRAGYWSVEAVVGAELLMLALQVGSSVRLMDLPDWSPPSDGRGGGVVGWALGTLLVAGFGRTLALLIVIGVACIGILLLIRYTPLIYLLAAIVAAVNNLRRRPDNGVQGSAPGGGGGGAAPARPAAVKFVPAQQPDKPGARPPGAADDEDAPVVPPAADLPPVRRRERPLPPSDPDTPKLSPELVAFAAPATATVGRSKRPKVTGAEAQTTVPSAPSPFLPSLDLLRPDAGIYTTTDATVLAERIEDVLGEFGVPVRVVHMESGPTVTQFGVEPLFIERAGQRRKVRVSNIVALADDLALALATPSVRIEAPVPGRAYVGIEIPNVDKSLVALRGIMESPELARQGGTLALPLGRNTSGGPVVLDLARAPHMLIAGATGSGKSVCINAIIMGLILRHGPDSLRFVMVDPKRVELAAYSGIPHLMGPVITEVDKVMPALTWLTLQMDDRYAMFREVGVRHLEGYNEWVHSQPPGEGAPKPLPYLVLIVDELADLMMTAPEDIERQLCRLAQKARATGIHLILATQRPSVDVVTGLIKANFPTRIAFAVTSQIDSRVILDSPGAERLLGRGDMLLMRPDLAKLLRVQGCLVTDDEINRTVAFWHAQTPGSSTQAALSAPQTGAVAGAPPAREPWADLYERNEEVDELLQNAIEVLQGVRYCSVSMLQRKLRIGYPRAARLMQQLEEQGIVGPDSGGSQGREVLLNSASETPLAAPTESPVAYG